MNKKRKLTKKEERYGDIFIAFMFIALALLFMIALSGCATPGYCGH